MWIKNLKIWDGVSDRLVDVDAIEVVDGKITSLDSSEACNGKSSMDMKGLFVIPGLIDAHVHMCLNPDLRDPLQQDKPGREDLLRQMTIRSEQMLQAGITTARDLGGGQWLELTLRDQINSGEVVGTRLICSGQPITSIKGHCYFWGGEAKDIADAKTVINRQVEHGVDLIKIMATGGTITVGTTPAEAQFDADSLTEMVNMAAEHSYRVAAHCHGTAGIRNASEAGVTTIEHCSWVGDSGWGKDFDENVMAMIAEKGIWISPTINAGWRRYIGSRQFEGMVKGNYDKMRQAGAKLIASTDAGIPNVRHEDLPKAIPVFAHFAGLSNVQALRAATSDCAEAIGLGQVVGQISPGYAADLVFYEGNPLEDLACLANPVRVMARGQWVEKSVA
ncbi:MAG: amidohydrolase family protein [bacterium]|nr:amidohydrolase family protein [Gammaproteobacteria bacterium]HIL96978.1 amidohydrolase family protein [Pseudomonadales bacterium]